MSNQSLYTELINMLAVFWLTASSGLEKLPWWFTISCSCSAETKERGTSYNSSKNYELWRSCTPKAPQVWDESREMSLNFQHRVADSRRVLLLFVLPSQRVKKSASCHIQCFCLDLFKSQKVGWFGIKSLRLICCSSKSNNVFFFSLFVLKGKSSISHEI